LAIDAITVTQVSDFLGRFRRLEATWADIRSAQFRTGFSRVAAAMQAMQTMRVELERKTAPRHNVFRVLGVHLDEDRTHTPVIADLLSPAGTHGQGHLFLREFLDQCRTKPGFPLPDGCIDSARWFVDTQRVTAFGTLDLVIACPARCYLIVIENKVYAGEQEDQVWRYSQWLDTQQRAYGTRALIYLTPDGRPSTTAKEREYFRLSYRGDLADALGRALLHIQADGVRATVSQYLTVIRDL